MIGRRQPAHNPAPLPVTACPELGGCTCADLVGWGAAASSAGDSVGPPAAMAGRGGGPLSVKLRAGAVELPAVLSVSPAMERTSEARCVGCEAPLNVMGVAVRSDSGEGGGKVALAVSTELTEDLPLWVVIEHV